LPEEDSTSTASSYFSPIYDIFLGEVKIHIATREHFQVTYSSLTLMLQTTWAKYMYVHYCCATVQQCTSYKSVLKSNTATSAQPSLLLMPLYLLPRALKYYTTYCCRTQVKDSGDCYSLTSNAASDHYKWRRIIEILSRFTTGAY
jgi:hypothetical protein